VVYDRFAHFTPMSMQRGVVSKERLATPVERGRAWRILPTSRHRGGRPIGAKLYVYGPVLPKYTLS
jgi:hypothetical protein